MVSVWIATSIFIGNFICHNFVCFIHSSPISQKKEEQGPVTVDEQEVFERKRFHSNVLAPAHHLHCYSGSSRFATLFITGCCFFIFLQVDGARFWRVIRRLRLVTSGIIPLLSASADR
jgi:hypothetical protein